MPNVYEAHHSNGQKYDVTTDADHTRHTNEDFKTHLLNIIDRTLGGAGGALIAGYIIHFTLKKRG